MKHWLSGTIVFVTTTVIMLLLGEWFVRQLYREDIVLFPRYHTDVQYGEFTIRRIRPDSQFVHTSRDGSWEFVTNRQGFRNRVDFAYEKPSGVFRVLSLGDSHTQGYEVRQEHTFSAVLERYLRNHAFNAEVINAGVSGFSTAEALVFLEQEGLKYQPDAVVLGFFANDLEDNIKAGVFALDQSGKLIENRFRHVPGVRIQNFIYALPGVKWLSENSYFYSLLFNTTWEFFKAQLAREAGEQIIEYAIPQQTGYSSYEIQLASALLERLYDQCKQAGIPLLLVDIPRVDDNESVGSSIPPALLAVASHNSDVLLHTERIFRDYLNAVELHVPHGHRHISEFSHAMIGVDVGRALLQISGAGSQTDESRLSSASKLD